MNEEIVHGDKNLRRCMILLVIILTIVGGWIIVLSFNYLDDIRSLAKEDLNEAARKLIVFTYFYAAGFVALIVITFGHLLWLGIRIIKSGQFPPPGMKVIRDTKNVRGIKAKLLGGIAIVLAVAILINGSIVIVFGNKLISNFAEKTHKKANCLTNRCTCPKPARVFS